ncbi:MAG TPA: group I intron-associated PD-(D/E)XK endonuclease [Gaiellaceae bacterium]|nr:group I intron-associated PD-(D/E)XK endonuclease [Gaiellaceae bacterium]
MLTTNQKGAIAETAIAHEAIKLGIGVYRPYGDERYDLIFDLRPKLLRVQCKWAPLDGDVVTIRCYSSRRARTGLGRRLYSSDEIDAFAAYCLELNTCYFLPMNEVSGPEIHLRCAPARNNQRRRINWAKDYEFAAKLNPLPGP